MKPLWYILKETKNLNEMNDNQAPLTVDGWRAKVAHHNQKALHHKNMYEKSPEGSEFKEIHRYNWLRHEDRLAEAKFQLRKQEILKGNK